MGRRGFFAELQHQAKVAARERARRARDAERAYRAAVRRAEQARKQEERAAQQLARANARERKRLALEAREAHVTSMEAEAERLNLELSEKYAEIDSLLEATLDVDDFVDLGALRRVVEHPPFDRTDLEAPTPLPPPIPEPPRPSPLIPPEPKGLQRLFGGKKYARRLAEAEADHQRALLLWRANVAGCESRRTAAAAQLADAEAKRVQELEMARQRYSEACAKREQEIARHNRKIDELVTNLGYGTVDAIQEYVSIVLSNSVYPEHFPVEHVFEYDAATAELDLRVLIPGPRAVSEIKSYKYSRSSDEMTTTTHSQKTCRDRYASAVSQVALRSLHEVFEADRRGLIKTIRLEVGTETTDPATGRETYLPYVAVGAQRESFQQLRLSKVDPDATLGHLGAAVSKNPYGFVTVDTTGIRRT